MDDPRAIVRDYYIPAFYAGATDVADLLVPDFCFRGPSARLDTTQAFLKASAHVAASVRRVEIERIFANGDEASAFYLLHLDHQVGAVPVAELYRHDTAIAPVCRMKVDKSAPAATRQHRGTTYYFCGIGCADAFSAAPEHYVDA